MNRLEEMNRVRVKSPDNNQIMGSHLVLPIMTFDAKGVRWMRQFVFKAKIAVAQFSDTLATCPYWGEPVIEVVSCGNIGSFAIDGSGWKDCMCEECVEGRKEVAAGWMPS